MNPNYTFSNVIRIDTLDGPVYHMKIPLISRFNTIADFFVDHPTETKINIPIGHSGLVNLLEFLDINTRVDHNKTQWIQMLEAADYLDLNLDYTDTLLDAFANFVEPDEKFGHSPDMYSSIRNVINKYRK